MQDSITGTQKSTKTEEKKTEEVVKPGKPVASYIIPGTGWHLVWTEDTKYFFYNPTSKTSIWEKPVEMENDPRVDEIINAGPSGKETTGIYKQFINLSNCFGRNGEIHLYNTRNRLLLTMP